MDEVSVSKFQLLQMGIRIIAKVNFGVKVNFVTETVGIKIEHGKNKHQNFLD